MAEGDYLSLRDEHLALMEGWAAGRYSSQNLYHPDAALVAAVDAATVQKHAAAAMAYGFLASLNARRSEAEHLHAEHGHVCDSWDMPNCGHNPCIVHKQATDRASQEDVGE